MVGWDYGYRSRCCYAPIRVGRKKVKNSNLKIQVWVCTKCKKNDVPIVEYNKDASIRTTQLINNSTKFIPDEDEL